ncbi:hypothetical protein ACH5RR_015599 [Cinchona calisaya]|uniref:Uncharacterized protein n=1 Tax=Cinchona calisaya TaxID=153742 RepID=A0ABD2ZX19_9GENT
MCTHPKLEPQKGVVRFQIPRVNVQRDVENTCPFRSLTKSQYNHLGVSIQFGLDPSSFLRLKLSEYLGELLRNLFDLAIPDLVHILMVLDDPFTPEPI